MPGQHDVLHPFSKIQVYSCPKKLLVLFFFVIYDMLCLGVIYVTSLLLHMLRTWGCWSLQAEGSSSMRHQESVIFLLEYLGFRYTNVLLVTTLLLSVENKCALINKTAEKLFLNSCNLPAEWWCFPRSWSLLA